MPSLTTAILSALRMVLRRWAMIMVVCAFDSAAKNQAAAGKKGREEIRKNDKIAQDVDGNNLK